MLNVPPTTFRNCGRRVGPAVMAVAAAGLLAACASTSTSSSAAAPRGTVSSSSRTPGASPSSGAPASASADSGGSGTPGLALCPSASLRVTVNVGQAGGAAGSTYYPVNFTNTSNSACGMYGYPGMSFVSADDTADHQIGAAAQRNPAYGKRAVRLAAGGSAHAWLQLAAAGNYPPSACRPVTAHWLRVFVPGDTVAVYVNHAFAACSSPSTPLLTVMPVRGGQGVQGTTP